VSTLHSVFVNGFQVLSFSVQIDVQMCLTTLNGANSKDSKGLYCPPDDEFHPKGIATRVRNIIINLSKSKTSPFGGGDSLFFPMTQITWNWLP
jgi:hypothetical protein